jgi:signal transduction histidine kinase/CheY-like chemotaxis protein
MPPADLHARNLPTARNSQESRRAARETTTASITSGASARLVALVGDEAGRVYPIERGPLLIGRGEDVDVPLMATDVSRVHACVRHDSGGWVLEDLGSTNGTSVNGIPVNYRTLSYGDRIQLASSVVLVFAHHDELEARTQQLQKLESLGRLAGELAHDFNNLLSIILSNVDFLDRHVRGHHPDDADLVESLADVRSAAVNGSAITRGLLEFARRGRSSKPELAALAEVCAEATSLMRRTADESIQIESDIDPTIEIRCDRAAMCQALVNLCLNARDAMPGGGRLGFAARRIDLSRPAALALHLQDGGPYVELLVSDTGAGMDEETRQRALEPFFTTKSSGKGTGLGLAAVYGTARGMGGNIFIESTPGSGTTLRLLVPEAIDDDTWVKAPTDPSVSVSGVSHEVESSRVVALVVDDEEMTRRSTVRILGHFGLEVLEADSGDAALKIFRRDGGHISLVVLDVFMPGQSGPEALAEMRSIDPDVKVLMMSGAASESFAVNAGADCFIAKPFAIDALRAKLEELGLLL